MKSINVTIRLSLFVVVLFLIDNINGCGFGGGGGGGGGGCGCRSRNKRNVDGDSISTTTITDESENRCNSKRMNKIIAENMKDNVVSSKNAIHNALNDEIGGYNVVMCTTDQQLFQFSIDSDEHCSGAGLNFKCYAFHME